MGIELLVVILQYGSVALCEEFSIPSAPTRTISSGPKNIYPAPLTPRNIRACIIRVKDVRIVCVRIFVMITGIIGIW